MRSTISIVLALAHLVLPVAAGVSAQDASGIPDPSIEPRPTVTPAAIEETRALAFQAPRWSVIKMSRGPAAREDHTWTVDGEGRYVYLFGGRDGAKVLGDLWRFDLEADTWQRLAPSGRTPAPRFGHSAVWTDSHGLVIFAGQRGADFFGDLWSYDPAVDRWRELPAAGGTPKARYGSCMIVGPDGRLWISHGFTFAGRFDDTRAYNLKNERWASIAPDERRPGERCLHDCFRSATGELVLYGGQDDANFALGDLWVTRANGTWRSLGEPRPKARRLYAVTEAGPYAWIFGGVGEDNGLLADLWRVDRKTLEFRRVDTSGPSPSGRYAATLITDALRGRLLLFGGQAGDARSDVWQLAGHHSQPAEADDDSTSSEDGAGLASPDRSLPPDADQPGDEG